MPLPERFLERLQSILPGESYYSVVASFSMRKPVYFRTNTLKTATEDLLTELKQLSIDPISTGMLPDCLSVQPEDKKILSASRAAEDGHFYIQGLASQIAAHLLAPEPGELVLDLAAAPGGKTTHLAMLMALEGELAAVEPVRDRFHKLKANLARQGADKFVRCYMQDGRLLGKKTPERFDRVLIDAPCSSESRMHPDEPASYQFWSEKKLKDCQRKQKALLRAAIDATRIGGEVLYATCSLSPEENEQVVTHTLKRVGEAVELLPIQFSEQLLKVIQVQSGLIEWQGKAMPEQINKTMRVLPGEHADGFYLALFRKTGKTGK